MNKAFVAGSIIGLVLAAPALAFADSTVTATADSHTAIDPSGIVVVGTGVSQSFGIGADAGYTAFVTVDGAEQGSVSSVSLTGDMSDHFVSVRGVARGGGSLPYCSGPSAPGWRMDLADGGCGGAKMVVIAAGSSVSCPWFMGAGCVIKE